MVTRRTRPSGYSRFTSWNAKAVALSGAAPREAAAAGLREIRSELRRRFKLSAEELEPITRLITELEDTTPRNAATPNAIRLIVENDRDKSGGSIALLAAQIRATTERAHQDALKRQLLEEEERFGAREERLAMVENHLTEGAAHIATLRRIIAEKKAAGENCAHTELSLENCLGLQQLFEDFRSSIDETRQRGEL
jgi:hypothetical protein